MDVKKLQGLTFIKCRTPTTQYVNGIAQQRACGHCDLCLYNKSLRYTLSMSLEERNHIFAYFVTLTYAPEFVPSYEIVDNLGYHKVYHYDRFKGKVVEHFRYDVPRTKVTLKPAFMRYYPVGKRGLSFELRDADEEHYPEININNLTSEDYERYYKHRQLYKEKYCKTNFEPSNLFVDLCPRRDLQSFIQQVKNFARRKCNGAAVKYFAVPDYGTNGLAPHWHIVFYFDSYDLYREFEKCTNYGTAKRPSYSADFIHQLWKYGITNSSRVRKSCASYVSSYLNSVSQFPNVINVAAPVRSYHSASFGQVLPKEVVKRELLNRNFRFFFNIKGYSHDGTEFTYSWNSQMFGRVLRRYPYIDPKDIPRVAAVYGLVNRFITQCRNIDASCSMMCIANALYDYARTSNHITLLDYVRLQDYASKYKNTDINLFYRLVLTTNAINRMSRFLQIDVADYLDLVASFYNYREMSSLTTLYSALESHPDYAPAYYYNLYDNYEHQDNNIYYVQYLAELMPKLADNVKHKHIAELYRFN